MVKASCQSEYSGEKGHLKNIAASKHCVPAQDLRSALQVAVLRGPDGHMLSLFESESGES